MLFSFLDVKTEQFSFPFESPTFEDAKRTFLTLLRGPNNNMLTQYPDDFILYHIGDFDKQSGLLLPNEAPYRVMTGFEAVKTLNNMKGGDEIVTREQVDCPSEDSSSIG